ncbi:TPA: hypothetical protein ACG4MZ_000094 [Klebsiella aerogenes]
MTDITELEQSNELLIANGNETANLLRHLADNEIDSDYFAVVSECESYGKETDAELSITEFALRAAGYVDALVEALEKAQQLATQQGNIACALFDEVTAQRQRIAVLEEAEQQLCAANVTLDARAELAERQLAELESRTVTVKLPSLNPEMFNGDVMFGYHKAQKEAVEFCAAAGIKVEVE